MRRNVITCNHLKKVGDMASGDNRKTFSLKKACGTPKILARSEGAAASGSLVYQSLRERLWNIESSTVIIPSAIPESTQILQELHVFQVFFSACRRTFASKNLNISQRIRRTVFYLNQDRRLIDLQPVFPVDVQWPRFRNSKIIQLRWVVFRMFMLNQCNVINGMAIDHLLCRLYIVCLVMMCCTEIPSCVHWTQHGRNIMQMLSLVI